MTIRHLFTEEQVAFLKKHCHGRRRKNTAALFNQHFQLALKDEQIIGCMKRKGFTNGMDTTFQKGCVPINTGKIPSYKMSKRTRFQKGHKPHNYKPIGSERINGDDYVDIKISHNKWKAKHVVLWERENGPVPKNHAILFSDGNRRNFSSDNLLLVTKRELFILNKKGLIGASGESTRTGLTLAALLIKIKDIENKGAKDPTKKKKRALPKVEDHEIFLSTNPLTKKIMRNKWKNRMKNAGAKIGLEYKDTHIHITLLHPASMPPQTKQELVEEVSSILAKKYVVPFHSSYLTMTKEETTCKH